MSSPGGIGSFAGTSGMRSSGEKRGVLSSSMSSSQGWRARRLWGKSQKGVCSDGTL